MLLKITCFFGGFLLASIFDTTMGEFQDWSILGAALTVASVETASKIYYSFNLVGWGMPTDINNLAEKLRWLGTQRYNIATLIEVMRNRKRFAELKINDESVSDDFAFIIAWPVPTAITLILTLL